jgi:type II secretory pathway component PulF
MPSPPLPPDARSPLDYQSPDIGSGPRRPIVDTPLLITGILFSVVVTAMAFVVAPRLTAVFRDFGMQLPGISVAVFRFCYFCRQGALPVLWLLMLAPAFVTPLLRRWPPEDPTRRHSRVARLLVTLALALFTAWIAIGMYLPYVQLIDVVSGGAPKR